MVLRGNKEGVSFYLNRLIKKKVRLEQVQITADGYSFCPDVILDHFHGAQSPKSKMTSGNQTAETETPHRSAPQQQKRLSVTTLLLECLEDGSGHTSSPPEREEYHRPRPKYRAQLPLPRNGCRSKLKRSFQSVNRFLLL